MRCVYATGIHEGDGGADTEICKDREGVDVCGFQRAAFGAWGGFRIVEGEDGESSEGITGKEGLALDEQTLEALDCGERESLDRAEGRKCEDREVIDLDHDSGINKRNKTQRG